jgi:NADPH-dependent 2,4-dienoyl-CoA reductase/sulfur reductase-like enzyme
MVQAELEANSVELFPGQSVQGIEARGSRLLCRTSQIDLEADLVLAAIGVKPNSELAAAAGLELGSENAIAVNALMQTSEPDVFSAGDCAEARHLVSGQKTWIPLALVANRGGWAVADNVTGGHTVLEGIVGTAVFKVFDLEVAKTGLNSDEAREYGFDPAAVTISTRSRAHAHPGSSTIRVHLTGDRGSGRLLGAQMVGREGAAHRINAAAVALHAGLGVAQFAQTDLAYAPPFGPVWDPLLTAANQLVKQI